jgi:hypothetical protein
MSSPCQLLNIQHPIIQSGMSRVAGPELAAEVSRAGGLGIIAGLNVPADALHAQIRQLRDLAGGAPFGVNLWLHPDLQPPIHPARVRADDIASVNAALNEARRAVDVPESMEPPAPRPDFLPEAIDVMLDERVPVWSVGLGLPDADLVLRCHERNVKVMAMIANVGDAREAAALGVDIIVAQGAEAGGHRSTWRAGARSDVGTFSLIPEVVDAVGVPVVAAGGVADGAGWSRRWRSAPPVCCSAHASWPRAIVCVRLVEARDSEIDERCDRGHDRLHRFPGARAAQSVRRRLRAQRRPGPARASAGLARRIDLDRRQARRSRRGGHHLQGVQADSVCGVRL